MPTNTLSSDTPSIRPDPLALKAALDSKRDLLMQMPPSEIVATPGLDASSATGIVIGSLPRIAKQRALITAQFGETGTACLDDLSSVAYATEQANIELAAADSASDLSAVSAALLEDHTLLLADAEALANRKLIDRARIDQGRPVHSYRTLVTSTLVLVALFREHWPVISSKTPLGEPDLERIERNAQMMMKRVNEREQGVNRLPALDLRSRAVSKLVRAYGEVRRMITFVRWWDEDVDAIAPSLWSGRRGKSRSEAVDPDVTDPQPPGVTPVMPVAPMVPSPNNGGAPFTS